jgi:hypothetical protein
MSNINESCQRSERQSPIESFQNFLVSSILSPLSTWLTSEKNISVSVEELLDVLKIQSGPQRSATNSSPTSLVQSTLAPTKAKPKSKPPSKEQVSGGPTCKYVFKRGEFKGKECGKPAASGSDFCDQCGKKSNKTAEDKKGSDGVEKTKTKAETKTLVGFTNSIAKKPEKLKVELREAGGQPNTFIDIQTNIVVKKITDGEKVVYVAIGLQEESGFRTLTEDEKKEATKRGFSLQNPVSVTSGDGKTEVMFPLGTNRLSADQPEKSKITTKKPVNGIPDIDSDHE